MAIVQVYGSACQIPDFDENTFVEDWGANNQNEQFWKKKELPSFFEVVEFDKEGNALLNQKQHEFAIEEVRRCRVGFWFYNNGFPTYITGKHYFYLQHWKLEDDIYAEYRDTDRRYFLFLNHWEQTPWCLGVIRCKKRREGATSQATSNLIYECIFYRNSICGLLSKSNIDASAAFTNMVSFGYRQLPVFLKPKQLNNKDSVTKLVFAHKSATVKDGKGAVIDDDIGHRSTIDFRAADKNAYDSGRLSRGLWDEGGKWNSEVPFSKFIAIVKKTMIKGGKRVGFMECPSTVNEMTKGGGAEFKKVWDGSNHFEQTRTTQRMARYFSPAYEGYVGFIDRHGMSVVDAPTPEQYEYLTKTHIGEGDLTESDIALGAKEYLLKVRNEKEGEDKQEETRMNPFDERDAFKTNSALCHFDADLLDELYANAVAIEKETLEYGNLSWKDNIRFTKPIWQSCTKEHARWTKPKGYKLPDGETVEQVGNSYHPLNKIEYACACDPFQNSITESGKGSKASSMALNRFENNGNDEIYNRMFILKYLARPPLVEMLHEDMVLQCFALGCQILIESKMDGGMRDYFKNNNCEAFLVYLPGRENAGIDPNADNKVLLVNSWEHYIMKEGKQGKLIYPSIIDDKDKKGDGLIDFNVQDTEISNEVMGGGWALVHDYFMKGNIRQKAKQMEASEYFSWIKTA